MGTPPVSQMDSDSPSRPMPLPMRAEVDLSLLDRRVVIVSGKGGTGKTTVSAALALAAVERGRRVLVVEVGPTEHVPPLLDPGGRPAGYAGRELRPGLRAMRIDPFSAVSEYIGLQVGSWAPIDLALRNRSLRQLLDGAPGWRELITLGKIWHLEQSLDHTGAPVFDLIVVDAPATGHGVSFLDVPRVVQSAVRTGPLARNAGLVEALVRDPEKTLLLPVCLAEDLPARETAELIGRMRERVGIAVDRVIVNALPSRPLPDDLSDLGDRLAALPRSLGLRVLPEPPVLAACASYLSSRHALAVHYVDVVAARTGLPLVGLPFMPGGLQRPGALRQIGEALLRRPHEVDLHGSAADDSVPQ
jgi:anion-transporting  ArsA/GET3 family ATPase